ncbi:hypothetical protein FPV67DRAFT_1509308, partial [Lyophyllum atratum]
LSVDISMTEPCQRTFLALDPGFVVVFERGFAAAFVGADFLAVALTAAAFFAGAFFVAAAFAFVVAVVPVTAFFADPRLAALVVFFAGAALALPASVFFMGAAFFAAAGLAGAGLAATGFLVVAAGFAAGLDAGLDGGLEFCMVW